MKKIFKCGLIVAGMLAIAPIGMTAVNTPTPVYAAQKIWQFLEIKKFINL